MEEVLPVNEGNGTFDGRFGGHEACLKTNNPAEALRRVSRVGSLIIIGRFHQKIKGKLRGWARVVRLASWRESPLDAVQ